MSNITKESAENIKNIALNEVNSYLNDLLSDNIDKCSKLSYWIKDYINYQRNEEDFNSKKLIRYERGNILKVHLGFKIGAEEGGLHYCVVLDNANAVNSDVITVIPLKSRKKVDEKVHNNNVDLGNDLYVKLKAKINGLSQSNRTMLLEVEKKLISFNTVLSSAEGNNSVLEQIDTLKAMQSETKEILNICKFRQQILKKSIREISKMKNGSIALVNQITTISKQRIYDPKNNNGIFYDIKLDPNNLDKINEKLTSLFIKK